MKTIKIFAVILFLVLTSFVNAQWTYGLSTYQENNDNPFHSPLPEKSFISSYDFNLGRSIDSIEIGYYGSFVSFGSIPDRNFFWHQIGLSTSFTNNNFGLVAEQRKGKKLYSYLDFQNIAAYFNGYYDIDQFYLTLNPVISYNRFSEIAILNNLKLSLNFNLNKGFDTETTLIIGGAFTYKKYLEPTQSGYYTYLDSTNQSITEYFSDQNVNSLSQLFTYARVAQSLTETTGIALQFANRSIFNKITESNKELNVIYGEESEIFEDPVNKQGNFLSAELTQVLFEDLQIKFGYYYNKITFPTQGNYDEAGNYFIDQLRSDKQTIFGSSLTKTIPLEFLGGSSLNLGLNFQTIKNTSTSYWFNYNNTTFGVSLGLQF